MKNERELEKISQFRVRRSAASSEEFLMGFIHFLNTVLLLGSICLLSDGVACRLKVIT